MDEIKPGDEALFGFLSDRMNLPDAHTILVVGVAQCNHPHHPKGHSHLAELIMASRPDLSEEALAQIYETVANRHRR